MHFLLSDAGMLALTSLANSYAPQFCGLYLHIFHQFLLPPLGEIQLHPQISHKINTSSAILYVEGQHLLAVFILLVPIMRVKKVVHLRCTIRPFLFEFVTRSY